MNENTQTDAALIECFAVIDRLTAERDRWKADADRLAAIVRRGHSATASHWENLGVDAAAALAAHDALTAKTEGK